MSRRYQNEAAEHPIHQPPEQSQAPTGPGGPLGSLPSDASQRAMGQMGRTSALALEGKTPTGEAHGRPPGLPDPQARSTIASEQGVIGPKACVNAHQARRPIVDKNARSCPDPWPSLGIITIDPDIYFGSASQHEGEQNIHLPGVGSELHAAPSAPQLFSSFPPLSLVPPLPDTLAHEDPSGGEGATSKWRATEDRYPELWKPPDLHIEALEKSGGALAPNDSPIILEGLEDPAPFGLAGVAENADTEEIEPSGVNAHKRGGALPVAGIASALAEGTADVEPAGEAKKAVAAKPEALVPWAQDKAGREVETPPRDGEGEPDALPPQSERMAKATPPQGKAMRKVDRARREGKRGANEPPPEALAQKGERNPEALSRKRKVERPMRHHQTVSANAVRCRKASQTRALANPVHRRDSHRTTSSCLFGRDQAHGIQEGGQLASEPSIRKGLSRP